MKLAIWIFALTLVLVMAGLAVTAAQPMGMENMEKAEKVKEIREKYKKAWESYQSEREKYIQTHQKYKDLRNQMAFNQAKKFLNNGCNFAERWLERFRVYVENSAMDEDKKQEILSQIDEYIDTIEEKRAKINDSATPQELREAAMEMRQAWIEIRQNLRVMAGQVAAFKLQLIIQKAEGVELRLEEKVQQLEAYGVDTSELEAVLEEYSEHLSNADDFVDNALDLYEEGKVVEANRELRKATAEIKEAFKEIKIFIKLTREKVSQGKIFFGNETGEVWARGDGIVRLKGDAIVNLRGEGTLEISPANAVITVVGFGNVTRGGSSDTVVYEGVGKAIIRGKNITVSIEGENITFFAKGKGSLYLDGTGFYRVKKLPEEEMEIHEYDGSVTVDIGEA